ncbi:MAG: hypothetical protein IT210_23825 [Armatimonadetes bacterium]|nr:hypothetical protein [Armatimonadota bacterium]
MTSRERILCAFQGGTPDRIPVAPFGMGRVSPDSPLGQELIRRTDILIDTWGGGDPFLGSKVPTRAEETGDTTSIIIDTPKGPLMRRHRRTAVTSATIEFPLKSARDVERFLSIPYKPPEVTTSAYDGWCERIGEEGFVMVGIGNAVCLPASWFSPEDFCLAWADDPEMVKRLTAVASERLNAYVGRLCQAGVKGFRIVGGEYVSVQLGPKAFRELVTPFDTELSRIIHRYGAVAYYHNHGNVMNYLPALAALEIDALDPLEAPPWGDVDLKEARRRAGDRLCFVGNLDDMEVLDSRPTAEAVAIAHERVLAHGSKAFVLGGTASGTYGERAAENFLALAEMVEGL